MSTETTPMGLKRSYLAEHLSASGAKALRSVSPYLVHGTHWRWIGGHEYLTGQGIEVAARWLAQQGETSSAETLRRLWRQANHGAPTSLFPSGPDEPDLAELAAPRPSVADLARLGAQAAEAKAARQTPYWWQRDLEEDL